MAGKLAARVTALVLTSLLVLTGCGQKEADQDQPTIKLGYSMPEAIKPPRQIADFQLVDQGGRPFFFQAPYAEVTIAYFGYTFCPDACPMTLGQFRQIIQELGPDADRVQFLFFTVDPERDTPERLAQYLENFDEQIIGLTGDEAAIADVTANWGVLFEKVTPEGTSADYLVNHTSSTFILDSEGKLRFRVPLNTETDLIVAEIQKLLPEKELQIEGAWARAASALLGEGDGHDEHGGHGSGATSAAYLTIKNSGSTDDTLIGAASPAAETVEIHNMWVDEADVMHMAPVDAVPVPAGGEAVLKPGGFHIMLIGLHQDLHEGDEIALTLTFEKAGSVQVVAPVKSP